MGNGFDLANGFKTSYIGFMNWIIPKKGSSIENIEKEIKTVTNWDLVLATEGIRDEKSYVIEKVEKELPTLHKLNIWYILFIHSKISNESNWNDVETQIYKYLVQDKIIENFDSKIETFKVFQQIVYIILVSKLGKKDLDSVANFFYEQLNDVEQDFERYLFEAAGYSQEKIVYNDKFGYKGTNKLLKFLMELDGGMEYFNLLTFNYTDPWHLRWYPNSGDSTDKCVVPKKVKMVHGSANSNLDSTNHIIFGIDSRYVDVNSINYRFTKVYRTLILNSLKNNNYSINENVYEPGINVIKFYGHSLCDADYSYFQQMFDFYSLYQNNYLKCYFYFSNWKNSGISDDKLLHINVAAVTNLFEHYGETLDNKDHGKNLLTRLQQTGRIIIKQINPSDCLK